MEVVPDRYDHRSVAVLCQRQGLRGNQWSGGGYLPDSLLPRIAAGCDSSQERLTCSGYPVRIPCGWSSWVGGACARVRVRGSRCTLEICSGES